MKILLVHNSYAQPAGGEDAVFANEVDLLRTHGHEVVTFVRSNGDVLERGVFPVLKALFRSKFNRLVYSEVRTLCEKERPDVAHIHNFWFALSPSVHAACHAAGIPVVQTLHNFRLVCLGALLVRNGRVCCDCVGRKACKGVFLRCYHGSFIQSTFLYRMLREKIRLIRNTEIFITLSHFGKCIFTKGGIPSGKLLVKPNFVSDIPIPPNAHNESGRVLFVGRLSLEKGIGVLLDAWDFVLKHNKVAGASLRMVGEGPEKPRILDFINRKNQTARVTVEGHCPAKDVTEKMMESGFLVFPSTWYEGMPMTMLEAYRCGLPIVASRMGAMQEIVTDGVTGLLFEPGNAQDLAEKIDWMLLHPQECLRMGLNARREYEQKYTPEKNYEMLIDIYRTAMARKERKTEG
jgi:glycosyltransferase involved in cell wall biosynthesis